MTKIQSTLCTIIVHTYICLLPLHSLTHGGEEQVHPLVSCSVLRHRKLILFHSIQSILFHHSRTLAQKAYCLITMPEIPGDPLCFIFQLPTLSNALELSTSLPLTSSFLHSVYIIIICLTITIIRFRCE